MLKNIASRVILAVTDFLYPPPLIPDADGDLDQFHQRFGEEEGEVLGEGQFAEVRLVREAVSDTGEGDGVKGGGEAPKDGGAGDDASKGGKVYACKVLRKGYMMKDNVVYNPPDPGVLEREVGILRTLGGRRACLSLEAVYESPRSIYIVTELCRGGDLQDFRRRLLSEGVGNSGKFRVPVDIIRRVSRQVLGAVDHCAQHGIIHRDIKPANVQLVDGSRNSDVRLIDFGSGAMDSPPTPQTMTDVESVPGKESQAGGEPQKDPPRHTTYAGSGFYNSPEMFQRSYTFKTDVWSTGVTLYVFGAGYPSGDILQDTFDLLQTSKNRDLQKLAGIDTVPNGFRDYVLEELLVYRHKRRRTAGEVLGCEFLNQSKEDEMHEG